MTEAIGSGDAPGILAAAKSAAVRSRAATVATQATGGASGTRDIITLSKAAKAAADILEEARAASAGKSAGLDRLDLDDLDSLLARAESGLREMLQGLGISGDTEFTLHVCPDGSIEVRGDHPRAAEIEAAINADPELREILVGVHVQSSAQRIAAAMAQAMQAGRADSDNAGAYFNWVRGIVAQTRSADHVFSVAGGKLSAGFVDPAGNRFAVNSGL